MFINSYFLTHKVKPTITIFKCNYFYIIMSNNLKFLLFIFLLFNLPLIFANNEIFVDVHNFTPYIDYTIYYNSNFEMYLPNFQELIYIKGLPDLNYKINDSKLYVYSNKGTLILKYKGTKFLENKNTLEKTLDFEILDETKISIKSDIKVLKINSDYSIDNDKYIYNTKENFILYLVYENKTKYLNFLFGLIISIVLLIIILGIYFYYKKQNIAKNKNLTQQEIANLLNLKKSHLSKILNKLERQDLIERKRVGKVNKIILKNKSTN